MTVEHVSVNPRVGSRGFVLVHRDWYELPDESDRLLRNAIVTTLNEDAFAPPGAQLLKRGYAVLQPPDEIPMAFTICDCAPVDGSPFDSLEDAEDFLRDHGVRHPQLGFNPIS